jgi:hypothetical protein
MPSQYVPFETYRLSMAAERECRPLGAYETGSDVPVRFHNLNLLWMFPKNFRLVVNVRKLFEVIGLPGNLAFRGRERAWGWRFQVLDLIW